MPTYWPSAGAHYAVGVIPDDSATRARAITWERRSLAGTLRTHPGPVACTPTSVTGTR